MNSFLFKTKRKLSIFMIWMMIVSMMPVSSLNVYAEEEIPEIINDETIIEQEEAEASIDEKAEVEESIDEQAEANESINEQIETEEALSDEEAPVIITWGTREHSGYVCVKRNDLPNASKGTLKIYLGENVCKEIDAFDEAEMYYEIAFFMEQSGTYKVGFEIDGKEYYSEAFEYTKTDKSVPEMKNVEWITNDDGRPTGIRFECESDFANNDYYYFLNIGDCFEAIYYSSCIDVADGKATYNFYSLNQDSLWVKNARNKIKVNNRSFDINKYNSTNSTLTYAWGDVEEEKPVEIEWTSTFGIYHVCFNQEPKETVYYEKIYKDGAVINNQKNKYQGHREWSSNALTRYLKESGKYKVAFVVDGVEYCTPELEYIRPQLTPPDVSNFAWIANEAGIPTGISFDYDELFSEGNYKYFVYLRNEITAQASNIYIEYKADIVKDGKVVFDFPKEWFTNGILEDNSLYILSIGTESEDVTVIANNNVTKNYSYTVGKPEGIPVGPQNTDFNYNTYIYEFTSGDSYLSDDTYYYFDVYCNNEYCSYFTIEPQKGTKEKVNLANMLNETGEYRVDIRANAKKDKSSEYYKTYLLNSLEFSYEKPDSKLDIPTNVMFDGKKVSWKPVEGANAYALKLECDFTYNDNTCHYNRLLPDVVTGTSFDVTKYLSKLSDVKNIIAYVKAVPDNCNNVATSDYAFKQYAPYSFNSVVSEMTVGDPATKQADIHIVNASGAKAAGVTYTSSNTAVATVNANGIVTAVSAGETTITANVKGYSETLTMDIVVMEDIYDMGFIDSSDKTFYKCGEEDTLQIFTSPLGIKPESIKCTVSGNSVTVEHFDEGTVSGNRVYLGGREILEVAGDSSDASGRTYKVKAKNLDKISEETEVNVTIEITSNSGKTFTKTKTYVVIPEELIPGIVGYKAFIFGARDKVLDKAKIYSFYFQEPFLEGWEWANGSQDISKYVGNNSYQFSAVYHSKNSGDVYESVTVYFELPSTSDFDNIKTQWCAGKSQEISINVGNLRSISNDEVEIKSSNPNVFEATKGTDNKITLSAKAKGTATLDYIVGGVKVASKKVTVVAGDCLNSSDDITFSFKDAEGKAIEPKADGTYNVDITNGGSGYTLGATAKLIIDGTVINDYSANVTSSDLSILKVANGSKLTGDKVANLTFVGTGDVFVTITANDVLKTSKTIKIHVIDKSYEAIILSKNVLTFNAALTDCWDYLYVIACGDREISGVEILDAGLFDSKCQPKVSESELNPIESDSGLESNNGVRLKPADIDSFESGKYVLALYFGFGDAKEVVYKFVTIKKTDIKPSIKVTQKSAADFAYADQTTEFYLNANGAIINDVTVNELHDDSKDQDKQCYSFDTRTNILKVSNFKGNKKLTLKIEVEDYKIITAEVKVKTTESKFALSATSGTIYSDVDGAYIEVSVKNSTRKTVVVDDDAVVSLSADGDYDIASAGDGIYKITVKKGKTPIASEKLILTYTSDKLEKKELNFNYTVKAVSLSKAKLVLGSKSLSLYNYPNQNAEVGTTLKLSGGCDALELLEGVEITEKTSAKLEPSLGRTLSVDYDNKTGEIKVKKVSDALVAGTYNFVITLKNASLPKGTITVTLPVKVVDVSGLTSKTSASVKVSVKNNVDLLNREGTSVVCTPKFTNIPAGSEYEIIDIAGKDAHLFMVNDANNIRLLTYSSILEKETYVVKIIYKVKANGATLTLTSPEIKLKFKTKKANVKINSKVGNVFNNSGDYKDIILTAFSGHNNIDIDKVELISANDAFTTAGEWDVDCYSVNIYYQPNVKVQKGKTYTLKFNVYLKDAAVDSKPVTVSYTVKIAK